MAPNEHSKSVIDNIVGNVDELSDSETIPVVETKTTTTSTSSVTVVKTKSKCELLYGPYPKAVPIPQLSDKDTDVTNQSIIDTAKSYKDINDIDYRDKKSPDEWLPRDGRLVRLTGKHPFNCEPPIALLDKYKFITPSSLHYVRNHGVCPKLEWDTHTMEFNNDTVNKSVTITMNDLLTVQPHIEKPITLVCAGNRRKEQNMIRQTIGFNWGGAGVGTNVYKGVLVRNVLLQYGIVTPELFESDDIDQYHCEFIGVEDLPNKVGPGPFLEKGVEWGKLVKYGTSVPLSRVLNPAYDVMLAWEANGEQLQPDHGYPVRLVIPGYIGGRMIKWLAKINIIKHESMNHYHYHDNRILPPEVTTSEQSLAEQWWYKPEYIFNELNINSVITKPNHNDSIDLSTIKNVCTSTYDVAGYAYTGGGRKITRVELSIDNGSTWKICTIHRTEKPTQYGMYWCWIWWTYPIKIIDLLQNACVHTMMVRAWDESNMPQPVNPTWNLMGMGNNHAFRIQCHVNQSTNQLWFEHPTQPGQLQGGYMARIADKPASAGFGRLLDQPELFGESTVSTTAVPPAATDKKDAVFTWAEIEKHTTEHDAWIVVNNKVYDCTEYLELHPGGFDSILINSGAIDSTEEFTAIHSTKAHKMLAKYYIGTVDLSSPKVNADAADTPDLLDEASGAKLALHPKKKVAFKLQEKITLSRDSYMLNFALPTKDHVLGLPTGKHVFISANINGETILRRYTPISCNSDVGCVKFVIKAYRPCERFPQGGKLSQYLDEIDVGTAVDFKGPVGEFEYLENGKFLLEGHKEPLLAKCFNMVAGGTGITPCMQIAHEILMNPNDPTRISLIFAARVEEDLLLRETLDEWSVKYASKFRVHYILSDGWGPNWSYSTGFVDKELFQEYFYKAEADVYNLMCGPPIMIDKGCKPAFQSLGHTMESMFSF